MKSDAELLHEFISQRNQVAFAELVNRHVDLVYSAALRQVNGDAHLARDVSQRVFIGLSRQAEKLSTRASLAGWLYTSVHHIAANAVRSERRRRTNEQAAHAMQQIDLQENDRPDWERLRPVLDEAMLELEEMDREAVLRRFFSGESFAVIGDALHLSHEAARKRVERALDRLHGLLARRGITSSASALGVALSQHAVSAAPLGFGAIVTHAAVTGASGLLAAGGIFAMNKLTLGITAAVVAGLLALVIVERGSLSQSERKLTMRRNELATLKDSLSREEQTLATDEAKSRDRAAARIAEAGAAGIDATPRVSLDERVRLDATHAGLFRRLQLDRGKLAALKELLVLRQQTDREVRNTLRSRGLSTEDLKRADLSALQLIAARDVDAKIGALLGKDGLEYVQTFERTSTHRAPFRELEQMLAALGQPLTPEQTDQLVAWTAAHGDPRFPVIPESVVAQAASMLTPFQLEQLKMVQASRGAVAQLMVANQTAALDGKLKLNPGSQRAFAEWAAKSQKAPIANASAP